MYVRPKFGKWNEKNCHLSPYSALCNLSIVAVTLTSLYSDSFSLFGAFSHPVLHRNGSLLLTTLVIKVSEHFLYNKPYSDHNAGTVAQFAKKHFHSSFVVQSVINAVAGLFDRTL